MRRTSSQIRSFSLAEVSGADHMRRAVDGDDADLVERPERLDRRARPEIGQVHLRATVAGRRGHAAGTIEHHRHRQRQLAMLVLDFHRHRQIRIEHGLEIAAHAERRRAAGQEQSAAEVGDEARQRSERLRPGLASRHVLQDDRAKGQQAGRIAAASPTALIVLTRSLPADRARLKLSGRPLALTSRIVAGASTRTAPSPRLFSGTRSPLAASSSR